MIIDDLYVVCVSRDKPETNTVLPVDPDAVLSRPITFQRFKPVSRRDQKVLDVDSKMDHQQLPRRHPSQVVVQELFGLPGLEKRFGLFAGERHYHGIHYNQLRSKKKIRKLCE
jgi:hypothetical protein